MRAVRRHRLRGVRPQGARAHHRPARLVRGLRRRVRRDGAPGPPDRVLGQQRLRQDPGHQHRGRELRRRRPRLAGSTACTSTSPRSMTLDQVEAVAAALAGGPRARHLGVRRPHRRHRPRSGPAHEGRARGPWRPIPSSNCSGPARARSSTSRQADAHRLPHHHRDPRPAEEAAAARARTSTSSRSRPFGCSTDDAVGRRAISCERRGSPTAADRKPWTRTTGTITGTPTARPPRQPGQRLPPSVGAAPARQAARRRDGARYRQRPGRVRHPPAGDVPGRRGVGSRVQRRRAFERSRAAAAARRSRSSFAQRDLMQPVPPDPASLACRVRSVLRGARTRRRSGAFAAQRDRAC